MGTLYERSRGPEPRRAHSPRRSSGSGPRSRAAPRVASSRGAGPRPGTAVASARNGIPAARHSSASRCFGMVARERQPLAGRASPRARPTGRRTPGPARELRRAPALLRATGSRRWNVRRSAPVMAHACAAASGSGRAKTSSTGSSRRARGAQARARLPQRGLLPHVEAARPVEPLHHRARLEGERQLPQPAVRVDVEVEPRGPREREAVVRQVVAHPEHQHHELRRVARQHLAVERQLAAGARARDPCVHHLPRRVRARDGERLLEPAGERALLRGRDGGHHRVAHECDPPHALGLRLRAIGPAQAVAVEAQVHLAVALGHEDARREAGQEALADDGIRDQQRRAVAGQQTHARLGGDERQQDCARPTELRLTSTPARRARPGSGVVRSGATAGLSPRLARHEVRFW